MHVSDESFDDNYALTTSSFGNSLKKKKRTPIMQNKRSPNLILIHQLPLKKKTFKMKKKKHFITSSLH